MAASTAKTILVVDDEVDLCEILQFDLEDAGFKVFKAYRAAEALEILDKQSIDLIVSDIRMPGGDGVYLLGEVRKKHYEFPPVIFVSGFADVTVAEAFHQGVVAFVAKPLSFDALIDSIRFHLLDVRDRWRELPKTPVSRSFERDFPSLSQVEEQASLLLGRGGLFLRIDEDLPRLNEIVRIKLNLQKDGISLEGYAICRWIRNANGPTKPRGAGLEWVQLNSGAVEFLFRLCAEQKRLPFIPKE